MTPLSIACACLVVIAVLYALTIMASAIISAIKEVLPLALLVFLLVIWAHSQDIKFLWVIQRLPQAINEILSQS